MTRLGLLCLVAVLAGGCGSQSTRTDGPTAGDAAAQLDGSGASDGAAPDGAAPDGAAPDGAPPDGAEPDGPPPDAPGDGAASCEWSDTNPCGTGNYCYAPACGQGVCTPLGTQEEDARSPVCGCDAQTYWNASVAAAHGMSVKLVGECVLGKTCGGFAGVQCPTHASCNYHLQTPSWCSGSDMTGTCWVLPTTCPSIVIGPQTRQCDAVACASECELIRTNARWYDDHTCPV